MSRTHRILLIVYGVITLALLGLGFAGLLSRRFGLSIPVVSTSIIPALDRHAVWGETLRGPAVLLAGPEWFFLIIVGIIIMIGIGIIVTLKLVRLLSR
ncbi:hypothetical protein DESC_610124 [Desulfosarcina cetonica]|uniref:hypothetical protein n=1 Tax=Desulfosarcina cetonica TaxID=90730 RepID=UPI0006D121B8|nr:hypothetical protein [Desulfosarcina cetonica]VTR67541.1 hypothetical protein DESC_610124 [Desulfosarcina cetonica]